MKFMQHLSIKRRLQVNAVVVGIAMVIMLAVIVNQARVMLQLNQAMEIAEELNVLELTMRKHEKNFLFYKSEEDLKAFSSESGKLQGMVHRLEGLFTARGLDASLLQDFKRYSAQYKKDFEQVVAFQRTIGLHPKDALYGKLRDAVHEVESLLGEQEDHRLLSAMLQLRRNEKDFMLRQDLKYLDKFNDNLAKMVQSVKDADLSSDYRTRILNLLDVYQKSFTELVRAQEALGLDLNSGALAKMKQSVSASDAIVLKMLEQTKQQIAASANGSMLLAVTVFILAGVVVMVLVYLTSSSIVKPLDKVCQVINEIRGHNDLTLSISHQGRDEITVLSRDFNSLIDDFKNLIFEVNTALATLNVATENLAETTSATSTGIQTQLQEADLVATAATEMQATIQDIAHNTEEAAKKAEQTNENARYGKSEVDSTVSRISELSGSLGHASEVVSQLEQDAVTIGSVLDVIRGIAEQTNLLALNAAIEAARAGEQGRGFAVVADEVRSLAQRTQSSTQEIESIISTLQQRTREVVSMMERCRMQGDESADQASKAGELLVSITQDVQTIMEMSTQIATAIDEQSQVASEVNQNVVKIRDIAEQASNHAKRNAHTSEEVAEQSKVLHQAIEKFKV